VPSCLKPLDVVVLCLRVLSCCYIIQHTTINRMMMGYDTVIAFYLCVEGCCFAYNYIFFDFSSGSISPILYQRIPSALIL